MLRRVVGLKDTMKQDAIVLVSKEDLLFYINANTKKNFKNDDEYQAAQVKLIYEAVLKGASLDEIKNAVGENDRNFKTIMNSVKSKAADLHITEMDRNTLVKILVEWDAENQPYQPRRLKTKLEPRKEVKSVEKNSIVIAPVKEIDFLTGTPVVVQHSKEQQPIVSADFMNFLSGSAVKQEVFQEADLFAELSPKVKR